MSKAKKLPPLPAKAPGIPADNRYKEQYGVIVVCSDQTVQKAVYEGLKAISAATLKVVST